MALYLLSYDIAEKDHDYQSLWDFLTNLRARRVLYSEWAVPWSNDSSALELTNAAIQHVMVDDKIFACELFESNTCAWRGLRITDEEFQKMLSDFARTGC